MVSRGWPWHVVIATALAFAATASAQQVGQVRGTVYDEDFDVPLALASVRIVELERETEATGQGNYVFNEVPPGTYTLVFFKKGYRRQVKGDVVVSAGKQVTVDAYLSNEFTEMEVFVVQDLQIGGGTEQGMLELRRVSPEFMDSISRELMEDAGAGDAAAALNLVAGATVEEGKYAVVRGLPDRYVNAQMNSVRLPTADEDKRAVQLDQFPSDAIESVRVSKTFTPDQQGDASGGAVNVVLKGVPDETVLKFGVGTSYNTEAGCGESFLTDRGRKLNCLGVPEKGLPTDPAALDAVGVSYGDTPIPYNWSMTAGGKFALLDGLDVGGLATIFYERDSSGYEDGIEDDWWVKSPDEPMSPQLKGQGQVGERKTALFDVVKGTESVQWGGLGVVGIETEDHSLTLAYLRTQAAEDISILAEDTRGKEFFYPGHDPDDPESPGHGNIGSLVDDAPYRRNQTLRYIERTTETLQLAGRHKFPFLKFGAEGGFMLLPPEIDWTLAMSQSGWEEPDKRLFSTKWHPARVFNDIVLIPETHRNADPSANFTVGNFQRTWKNIDEESDQYFANMKFPFTQWTGTEGYVKLGIFRDEVTRTYKEESFGNFGEAATEYAGPWEAYWSAVWPSEDHPVLEAPSGDDDIDGVDTDYDGNQEISAWYYMVDLPLCSWFNVIGGVRYETTKLSIVNHPEPGVQFVNLEELTITNPDPSFTDTEFERDDVLPALAFQFKPFDEITLRGSYAETVARQTFKELSPIQQQEFLGADVFIGNPDLRMSELRNYDLRVDYRPYAGGLVSMSWFRKDIKAPIEYVQKSVSGFAFTTPLNFPEGQMTGYEFEVRQDLGQYWEKLEGITLGGNATFIESEVTLPDEEFDKVSDIGFPFRTRRMLNAPEHLYNMYMTYDLKQTGTRLGLFYTVRGDTLVVGAGQRKGSFVPDIYETEYGTLNFSLSQDLGDRWTLKFQGKNLTNPAIQRVYRSQFVEDERVKSSYRKGMEFSISLSVSF